MVGTLRRLIDAPDRRMALGRRARARAEHYAPQRMAKAYLETYAELLMPKAVTGSQTLHALKG